MSIFNPGRLAVLECDSLNAERFPEDFMFQLTPEEAELSRSQNIKYRPYAFTEHGAIQAANVLSSPRAIKMGVFVVRAFVKLHQMLASNKELPQKVDELERKLQTHDRAIVDILKAIRQLMNPPPPARRPIGFTADLEGKT
jgi:hypothetical protein